MRLALLSNVTVDLLADMVKKGHEVYLPAGYDTWQQEAMTPGSGLYAFRPEAVAVLLHAGACDWPDRDAGCRQIDGWCDALAALTAGLPGVPVFVSSLDVPGSCQYGAEPRSESFLETYFIESVEKLHEKGARIYILPVKDAVMELGRKGFYSAKMWYVGSMPYSIKGLSAIAGLIDRYAGVAKGMHKKCIAVDLDNTLWGGVIGEDGVEGIVLSDHKEGARYRDAQRLLKKMKDRGVMLAILSKNNPEDVEPVFAHPDMVLRHEDFVAEAVNWDQKSVNIRQMAQDLNIGLDAFVFLDDNPAEREQMKAECPEVTVVDFPRDSSLLPETLQKVYDDCFLSLEVTGEDAQKTAMYRAESRRRAERTASASVEDYLRNLEMTMSIHRMLPQEEKRVVQLVNKTNQFNVTTKRYSEEEIQKLAGIGDVVTVHMADKYGDQGLVAVLILTYAGEEADIDTFLMSCRVMGRNAENEILARVRGRLEEKGVKTVRAAFVKTAKNAPVQDLFDRLGFTLVSGEIRSTGDRKQYAAAADALPAVTGLFARVEEDWA